MPELFKTRGYSVSFFSGDQDHGVHVHITKGHSRDVSKFVLTKDRRVVLGHNNGRLSQVEIDKIRIDFQGQYELIIGKWDSMFGGVHHFDK